jgi:hypothetical protein
MVRSNYYSQFLSDALYQDWQREVHFAFFSTFDVLLLMYMYAIEGKGFQSNRKELHTSIASSL